MMIKTDLNHEYVEIQEKRRVKVNERPKMSKDAFSQAVVREHLITLLQKFGKDPKNISVIDLQFIADRLSQVANQERKWTWQYLRQVINGQLDVSGKLAQAIEDLTPIAVIQKDMMAQAHSVQVFTVGNVKPGALVLKDSQPCGFAGCPLEFVPGAWNQRFCSPECRKAERKRKRANQ